MNMKTLVILIVVGISLSAFAQDGKVMDKTGESWEREKSGDNERGEQSEDQRFSQGNSQNNAQNTAANKVATNCIAILRNTAGTSPESEIKKCSVLRGLAVSVNENLESGVATASSVKNEITCKRTSGFTLDYNECVNAIKALNVVVNAESVMALQQQVRTDISNKNIQERTVKQAAAGDLTTGVFDATISANKFAKGIEQEKALAYSGAVAALGATYTKWKKPETMINEKCTTAQKIAVPEAETSLAKKAATGVGVDQAAVLAQAKAAAATTNCLNEVKSSISQSFLVPNKDVKAVLAMKISEYIAKGIAAGIKMGQYDTRAAAVEKAKDALASDEEDAMMERCVFNPTDPICSKSDTRTPGTSFSPGEFSLGSGGSNSFSMDSGSGEFGEDGSPSTVGGDTVAGTNSPFLDEAKEAKGIVDPAAAAQVTPTGGAGGGGGGVGGGGGGGSASLGGDLEGANKDGDKDPSLKTSKSSGNYAFGAGGGYSAVKGGKDEANPFASLFDSKSSGGIEEDRSIASGDIDGSASGLFQKISNRYNAVKSQNRIEANNLE